MKRTLFSLLFAFMLSSASSAGGSETSITSDPAAIRLAVPGVAVTGWNQLYGAPVRDLRLLNFLNFHVAGVFNPKGGRRCQ